MTITAQVPETRLDYDPKDIIAARVAEEVASGMLVNLGIGLPSRVVGFLKDVEGVFFQAENGVIGLGARPPEGMEDPFLTDAGGGFVSAVPGAASIDSAMSFALIRGGHLDMTVLGGLEVDSEGCLANWTVPGKMVPGMGGAMDLVTGARRVVVAMTHTAKGKPKIKQACSLPLTALQRVDLIVTEMAVIEPSDAGLVLREVGPGQSVDSVMNATDAPLLFDDEPPEMELSLPPINAVEQVLTS
ncbi:MAG: 3-oxoacid CoA-transferase subunit B [Pseudomonadota bacterium]